MMRGIGSGIERCFATGAADAGFVVIVFTMRASDLGFSAGVVLFEGSVLAARIAGGFLMKVVSMTSGFFSKWDFPERGSAMGIGLT